ncbi:MAG: branched-chain amino acid ABC transporter permease, partial [Chloroflexi bacterium]
MAYFIQLVFAGIAVGCIYALIGLGFSIIFKASGVINFAQGELLLVGAYIVSSGVFEWHIGFLPALFLGIAVTVAIGLLFERFILRRMVGRPVFSILMITIGLDIVLRTGVILRWGSNPISPGTPFEITSGVNFGGV